MTEHTDPLPDGWEDLDSIGSYYEAIREIGRLVKAGEMKLPDMFKKRVR